MARAKRSFVASYSVTSKMSSKVCIFGTGAIGASYAWVLSRAIPPSNIVCVCRSNYSAALSNGFTISSTIWGNDLNVKPTIVPDITTASAHAPYDYLITTSKALPTSPPTPELLAPLISPSTTIVLIQNGISIEPAYSGLYPSNPLLSCVVYLPVTSTSPAIISHKEVEHLHIGTYPSTAPSAHKEAADTFAGLIRQGGASATVHDDIQFQRWSKHVVNASWNPICAISRSRDAVFMKSSPAAADYVRDVMMEIARVAQATGYKEIDEKLVDHQLGRAKARPLPGVEPSMLADALAGRALEVDAIVGNTLEIAKEKGVQTPLLNGVYAMAKALDESLRAN